MTYNKILVSCKYSIAFRRAVGLSFIPPVRTLRGVGLCLVLALFIGLILGVSLIPVVGVALAGIISYGLLRLYADYLPARSALPYVLLF